MSSVVSAESSQKTSSSKMTFSSSSSSSSSSMKKVVSGSSQVVESSMVSGSSNAMQQSVQQSMQSAQSMQSSSSSTMMQSSSSAMSESSSSSSSMKMMQSSSSSKSIKSSSMLSAIDVKSGSGSFLDSISPDITKGLELEMGKLFADMDSEMKQIRDQLHLSPLALPGSADELIKLDAESLKGYVDDLNKDKYKFNFDVHEFQSESVHVKADGNKIEVRGKKVSKKDGDEQSEEYTKTYELPSEVKPETVTSSIYKDGVLTVELPVTETSVEASFTLPPPEA